MPRPGKPGQMAINFTSFDGVRKKRLNVLMVTLTLAFTGKVYQNRASALGSLGLQRKSSILQGRTFQIRGSVVCYGVL